MRKILFARHNYAKVPAYRLLTTIEQVDDETRVYKRAATAEARPYLQQLLHNQHSIADTVGERATVVMGRLEADDCISYPFVPYPTLQSLICEQLLQDNYDAAYAYLQDWISWIEALPTIESNPDTSSSLVAIYEDTLPRETVVCLQVGMLDLTAENVLWNAAEHTYVLIDHDLVLPDPVPLQIVLFRMIFFLCHNLRHVLQHAADRHPVHQLGYAGFLVPTSWDIQRWITPDALPELLKGEARLQSHYANAPVTIPYSAQQKVMAERSQPNVAVQLARKDEAIITGFETYDRDTRAYKQWLSERDARIAQLEPRIKQQEADLTTLHDWVVERDATIRKDADDIRAYQDWLAERDEQIAAIKERVAQQEADLTTLHTWVVERDAVIRKDADDVRTYQNWLAERDEQIAGLTEHFTSLTEHITGLIAQVAHQEADITTLHAWVAERDDYIVGLQAAIADRDLHIQQLHRYGTDTAAQLAQLQLEQLQIQSSFGWKLLMRFWQLRERVLPAQGVASRSLRLAWRARRVLKQRGPGGFARHSARWAIRRVRRTNNGQAAVSITMQETLTAPAEHVVASPAELDAYERWIAEHEPDAQMLQEQVSQARALSDQPLISILTPVYNPEPAVIEAMIESVRAQTYGQWELWLVNGSPDNQTVNAVLQRHAELDERIHILTLDQNNGIVANTNAGLKRVQGAFVAFVDHDDTLARFALFEVAKLLNAQPATDMIYSDSDLLSSDGSRRFGPLFKPDWSPAIMLSANYATHLCVVRTALLAELEGLTPGTDGAQDWDLILRVSEQTDAIAHIPKVLYHWRESLVSTATDIKRKPYVMSAQLVVIAQHLARQGVVAQAYFDTTGYVRVSWPLIKQTLVSIIIPSRNLRMLQHCIGTIFTRTAYQHFELIVVDTTADSSIATYYSAHPNHRLRVLRHTAPFNYSAVNNLAAKQANGTALLFLNDDIEIIDSEWLAELVRWVELDQIGMVGAKLLYNDRRIQHAGVVIGLGGFADHPFAGGSEGQHTMYGCTEWYRNYSAVTGACAMIRRELFERVGGFDESMVICGSDVELCLRVGRLGYQIMYTPFARLLHLERTTRGTAIPSNDFVQSYLHYHQLLMDGDPYYNPNLSVWSMRPQLHRQGEETSVNFVHHFLEQLGVAASVAV